MKPVMQTLFGARSGNCLAACFASLLERPICDFDGIDGTKEAVDFWNEIRDRLSLMGYGVLWYERFKGTDIPAGEIIGGGKSPRGEFDHVVVMRDGKVVHDPHPEGGGLDGEVRYWILVYPLTLRCKGGHMAGEKLKQLISEMVNIP